MNIENVKKAIAIMERAKARDSVHMLRYQQPAKDQGFVSTEQELHACGNTACFAGHIAISPEFAEFGGYATNGYPEILGKESLNSAEVLCLWLGIKYNTAYNFIFGGSESNFYGKEWADVKAQDVIDKLNLLLEGKLE